MTKKPGRQFFKENSRVTPYHAMSLLHRVIPSLVMPLFKTRRLNAFRNNLAVNQLLCVIFQEKCQYQIQVRMLYCL